MKDVDELYEQLLEGFQKKGYVNPKAMLDYRLKQLIEEGRTRGQAILHLSQHPEEEERLETAEKQASRKAEIPSKEQRTADEQRVKELEEKIARLTVLFSKGEIGEEAYKTALKTLEKELEDLRPREPVREMPRRMYSESFEPVEEVYERRFSTAQRLLKLLTSPSEAMKDIASAPSYEGIAIVLVATLVFSSIYSWEVIQKMEVSGPYSSDVISYISATLGWAVILGTILFVIKWAIKSVIVNYACESESDWNFETAASITGYAYIPGIIIVIINVLVVWFVFPTLYYDTANLNAARQSISDYDAQMAGFKFVYTVPLQLLELLWISYLGGLGAHFGTDENCSIGKGMAVFFVLGLIGYLVLYAFRIW